MTKRRIAFVHIVTDATVSYSHGLAVLAGTLIEAGTEPEQIRLFVLRSQSSNEFAVSIAEFRPAVVFFSVWSNQWTRAVAVAKALRAIEPAVSLWVGGIHITVQPRDLSGTPFDGSVLGEGESTISSLMSTAKTMFQQTIPGTMVNDLDSLPMPYLDMFSIEDVREYPSVMFSRGCPYQCSYCVSRNGGIGGQIRWKSPGKAVSEVRDLLRFAKSTEFFIDDDTFLKNPGWVREFCSIYQSGSRVPYYCNARPETVRPDLLDKLRESGCRGIGIGIESGSERMRRDILQRPMSDDVILRAFGAAKSAGLFTWSFNMVGLPGETAEDLEKTIAINERASVDAVRVSIFTPYPGTPSYRGGAAGSDSPSSYFRDPSELPADLYARYKNWIERLGAEGRLWFTKSEESDAAATD